MSDRPIARLPAESPDDEDCTICGDDNMAAVIDGGVNCNYCGNQFSWCAHMYEPATPEDQVEYWKKRALAAESKVSPGAPQDIKTVIDSISGLSDDDRRRLLNGFNKAMAML